MEGLTKYEKARIIGARALQISMGAPLLVDRKDEMSPIEIAKKEFAKRTLPITIRREEPKKEIPILKPEKGEKNKNKKD
jgi:DNA-directed RNA polymerase I, II, and III subunit RPABC2